MTFRIFSGDARKAIADHIIGAPPVIPNRHGSNHGTDLLVQGGTKVKTEYDPTGGGGGYDPTGGGGGSGGEGGGTLPPTTGPGRTPVTDCSGAKAADNSGKCPPEIQTNADGSKYQWFRRTDGNGLAYCCPTRILDLPPGTPPPPQTYGDITAAVCPDGNTLGVVVFNWAQANTVNNSQPFAGKTPAQYVQERKTACEKGGDSFNLITFQAADGTSRAAAGCCGELVLGPTPPPVHPPTVTPVIDPVPPIYGHDGATGGGTTPPAAASITCHGPVIQSIAPGQKGYMACQMELIATSSDCSKNLSTGNETYTASSTAYPASCAEATTHQPLLIVKNPSSATIAAGTVVVAVKNNMHADSEGIILFVPCST
tara:strand:- start:8751 stop:9860 length:1110 start_codon:yes stop_codon:yes gene_type:complete